MRFVFGDCEFDIERYELRRAGQVVLLEPKAFRVLAYLLRQHGRAVAKSDLLQEFWPGTSADSYKEYSLRNCLNKIRQVIGDAGTQRAVIETLRSYGYRFAAVVTTASTDSVVSGEAQQGYESNRRPRSSSAQRLPLPGRRPLTVLRCALVDGPHLTRLDHEDFQTVIQSFYTACEKVIQHFDGYIAQYDSDGLLVYFGYPVAYEDAAQRAVRTGLELVETVQQLVLPGHQIRGTHLAVCIGIHTGHMVVEEQESVASRALSTAGMTMTIAKRVQERAVPDMVVISAGTHALVQGYFTCQALDEQFSVGGEQRLALYQVLGESGRYTRLEVAASRGLTPFVGREPEVALLLHRWEQVQDGMGQVVVLSGEPGIGKSRLVQVLRDHITHGPSTYLECRSSPYYQNTALYPITDLLQRVLHWQRDDTPEEKLRKLEATLTPYMLAHAETIPLLAALLSVPLPLERYAPLNLSPQQQKQKTLATLVEWFEQQGERQPVLAVWEDLHWADPTTLELLSLLIEQVPAARLLVLLTCRPEFHPPWNPRSPHTQLTLSRLSRSESEAMVAQVVHGKALPPELRAHVLAKTDGVPLFVEELLKMILELGLVKEEESHYVLAGPVSSTAIPATLQDSLIARLDRLTEARGVAQLGATLGREFLYEVLQAVSSLDEPTLQQRLMQLVQAELLYQRGLPPHASYRFKHALLQDAAYQSLLRSTRQQYHQRIAEVLAERFPETAETQPEVVAQHYTKAGLHAEAVPYWQQAGQLALERSAYREAVASLERGLEALTHLPQTRATLEQAVDLRLALRSALLPSGGWERILVLLHEAESLATALEDSRRLEQVLLFLSLYFYLMGVYNQSITAGQRALALATTSGDVVMQALANDYLGRAYRAQGDYRRAIDCFGQTVAALDGPRRHEKSYGQLVLPAVYSRARLAECHAELGEFAEGMAIGEEGLRIVGEVAHPRSFMYASAAVGLVSLRQGNLSKALPLLEQAVSICQEADLPVFFPGVAAVLGAAYILGGRVTDAVLLLTQALEQAIATETLAFQALCTLTLGEAQLLAGHLDEAHTLAERTLAFTRAHQERGNEAYALRLLGNIATRRESPDLEQAEAHYQHALALARELGMRPLQAHCHHSLGTLYRQTGRDELAQAALSTAIEMYRAMDMTFWLPQAEAALAQGK